MQSESLVTSIDGDQDTQSPFTRRPEAAAETSCNIERRLMQLCLIAGLLGSWPPFIPSSVRWRHLKIRVDDQRIPSPRNRLLQCHAVTTLVIFRALVGTAKMGETAVMASALSHPTFYGAAVLILCVFLYRKFRKPRDPRRPKQVPPTIPIPFIGHALGLLIYHNHYYTKIR